MKLLLILFALFIIAGIARAKPENEAQMIWLIFRSALVFVTTIVAIVVLMWAFVYGPMMQ